MAINKPADFIQSLKDKLIKTGRVALNKGAMRWLAGKAKDSLNDVSAATLAPMNRAILKSVPTRKADRVSPGEMFFFVYDAKYKKKLRYYDKFPLIFPLEFYKDGFLGMNLHYLSPDLRLKLLDALMTLKNNDKFDETTKLKLSYQIVLNLSKFVKPTIHKYLYSQIKSKFIKVDANEWHWVVLLPTEKFVDERDKTPKKITSKKVHQDSNSRI